MKPRKSWNWIVHLSFFLLWEKLNLIVMLSYDISSQNIWSYFVTLLYCFSYIKLYSNKLRWLRLLIALMLLRVILPLKYFHTISNLRRIFVYLVSLENVLCCCNFFFLNDEKRLASPLTKLSSCSKVLRNFFVYDVWHNSYVVVKEPKKSGSPLF